ncbi:MAG: hypothetical protein ACLFQH_09925 [Halothiobacillaceae bacterium]
MIACAGVLAFSSAHAQPMQGEGAMPPGGHGGAMGEQQLTPEQQEFVQEFQQKQGELNRIQDQLAQIESQVVESSPEIQSMREDLENKVADRMRAEGVRPNEMIGELEAIAGQLDQGIEDEAERNALIEDFESKRERFLSVQRQALQDEEVQKTQQALQDSVMTAMIDAEPETEKMIEDLQKKQQELQQMQQRAMQMQ